MGSISPAVTLSVGLWNPCFQLLTFFFFQKSWVADNRMQSFVNLKNPHFIDKRT